ncbi:MAG: tripartite tricarboxylate transporter TctB family protein [Deltaproteobacteria bacterium]|nr:tripartite tricarboxylate transporter TctB family protein [Deltaproteobacteria bacterium]
MNAERVGGVFWILFGLLVMYGSYRLGLGSLQAPGSGFLGFLAGIFVLIMALIVLIQSFFSQEPSEKLPALWRGMKWHKPLAVALLVLAYNLALERLGFILSAAVFLVIMFRGVERFSWLKSLWVTFLVVACSYLLFQTFLRVSLPQGFLGF